LQQTADTVAVYLETVARVFPLGSDSSNGCEREVPAGIPQIGGIHAFLDDLSAPRPSESDWRRFASLQLRRVSLGVESGDPSVRALFGKHWENDDLRGTVAALKAAGLGVGVIVLVGAGGVDHSKRHFEATVDLIHSLVLGPGDLVSLLDAHELLDPESESRAAGAEAPLRGQAWLDQQSAFLERLTPVRKVRKAKVIPYSLEKQGIS
jgi:hypothetical protein